MTALSLSLFRCITSFLRHKTVVLVTHQVQFLERADKVLLLDQGAPIAFGTPQELRDRGIDLLALTKDHVEKQVEDQEVYRERALSQLSRDSQVRGGFSERSDNK